MKQQALIAFVAGIIIIVVSAYTDRTIKVVPSANNTTNKSTCINSFDSLKAAKVQKKLLDKQVSLFKATGQSEDAKLVSTRSSNLKEMIAVLEKLIDDPKLACNKYLKDEPKSTQKVI